MRPTLVTTQLDAHVTPLAFAPHEGFSPQTSPALVTAHCVPEVCDDDVVVVVVVVVDDVVVMAESAAVDDALDALGVASAGSTDVDVADVVAWEEADPVGPAGAIVWVVLTVTGWGFGLDAVLAVRTVELVVAAVSATAAAGRSRTMRAAPMAMTVAVITATYKHFRIRTPSPTAASFAVFWRPSDARLSPRSQSPN